MRHPCWDSNVIPFKNSNYRIYTALPTAEYGILSDPYIFASYELLKMRFQSITLQKWRQFADATVEFDDRLTILTGSNGSGKTTILSLLGRHYNWNVGFTGIMRRKSSGINYLADSRFAERSPDERVEIGTVKYSNETQTPIVTAVQTSPEYSPEFPQMQSVPGLFIPSHRPQYSYQAVTTIPTQALGRAAVYNEYFNSAFSRYRGSGGGRSPVQIMKETLISLMVFSQQSPNLIPDENAGRVFSDFEKILHLLLPKNIGFEKLLVQVPEVMLQTRTGTFPIDAVSGGISSLVDIAWRIFMYDPEGKEFVCSIDEPENHLHPAMQQSLLPNLLNAFPNVQFIVATHSPFMITAVPNSAVYVLDFNREGGIVSQKLDITDKAGTADEILRGVLGLPFTMPLWAEQKITEIVNRHVQKGVTESTSDEIDAELKAAGLEKYSSTAILRLVEELPDES